MCLKERTYIHIREAAVTLLQIASLSAVFWYHACALATYLINRMPTPTLAMHSPFEKLYHKEPCLDLLRVFGCACYPLMTPYIVNKLQPKTARCIFIRFAAGYKWYICYNLTTKKIIISRHVFFNEDLLPYAEFSNSMSTIAPASAPIKSSIQPCYSFTQSTVQQLILAPHTSSVSTTLASG